jgi:hypothetical protein
MRLPLVMQGVSKRWGVLPRFFVAEVTGMLARVARDFRTVRDDTVNKATVNVYADSIQNRTFQLVGGEGGNALLGRGKNRPHV